MSLRKLAFAGLASAAIIVACGSDPKPTEPCTEGRPDFELLIKAAVGPLPEDLIVRVEYGGGEEEYVLANPATDPRVIFCDPSDRDGNVIDAGTPAPNGVGGAGAGAGGAGGEGGAPSRGPAEALFCGIWSFGPATIELETVAYPMVEPLDLTHKDGVCTGQAELKLEMSDGGMMR